MFGKRILDGQTRLAGGISMTTATRASRNKPSVHLYPMNERRYAKTAGHEECHEGAAEARNEGRRRCS